MGINWSKVPPGVHDDITNYIDDNNLGDELDTIDPKTAFHYWLQWNGLVGFTESILQAGEALGVFEVRK